MNTKVLNATFIPNPSSFISPYNALFFFTVLTPPKIPHNLLIYVYYFLSILPTNV